MATFTIEGTKITSPQYPNFTAQVIKETSLDSFEIKLKEKSQLRCYAIENYQILVFPEYNAAGFDYKHLDEFLKQAAKFYLTTVIEPNRTYYKRYLKR